MNRAARKLTLAAAMALVAAGVASTAGALEPGAEAAAKAALKRASEKYLSTEFASAIGLLTKAARGCAGARCSSATKAAVLRDLGVMQFRNGDKSSAQKSFADALALEPDLTLGSNYDAPDVRVAFNAAKGGGGESPEPPPAGDFTHTPATEQTVNTPLPVYAEISGVAIARAVVRYKGAGMADWARLDMKRLGKGWGALIPCGAVTAGTLRYWIQGLDADGDAAASSGDARHPFEIPIRSEIASESPHLPGRAAPQSCEEGATAEREHVEHSEGPAQPARETEKRAMGEPSPYARWWIGVAGAVDFLSLPGGNNLCALTSSATPANASGYYCTNPNGSDFPNRTDSSQNAALIPGQAGQVAGGLHAGDLRALIAVDYALSPEILVGARIGYVLNSYPSGGAAVVDHHAFGPKVHAEARGTYVFGDDPLAHEGFAPTVFVSGGVAEFDGHSTSIVSMSPKASTLPISQPVNIWITSGPWFLAFGGGARYQFSARAAFNAALRVNVAVGGLGALLSFGPEIAFQYGL
jgi:hypothetical protein